jgi:hypothetical protein
MDDGPAQELAVFLAALEMPTEARAAFLDGSCAGDAELRSRVEALLISHKDVGGFLDGSPVKAALSQAAHSLSFARPGSRIGRYKLLEQIGEGGCGIVFLAEQEEPVRRLIALKLIKPGMDTKNVIARFEAERQALALMEHPNIAKVFDAGATENGRPYFVMELVKGVKITDYCEEHPDANSSGCRAQSNPGTGWQGTRLDHGPNGRWENNALQSAPKGSRGTGFRR